MKKLLIGIFCLFVLQPVGSQVITHQIYDDSYAHVPLQFGFPIYGRIFTDSYMFSNGVVGFGSVNNHWCCSGYDLTNARGYQFNYSIMGLQTDLINYGSGRFQTEGTPQYQRYRWENISEFGVPQNLNTFGIEIRPSGFIGIYHENINISSWRPVTVGITGDTTQGEYAQFYHGQGYVSNQNVSYITQTTGDMCLINPLFSTTCSGYQQAYDAQQCSINPLYRPSCVGYDEAYHAQQCSLNPLYSRTCSGYAEAYALANIVPSTSTTTVSTQSPQVLVSTTGTISVETPVVADPVVNEVISAPSTTSQTSPTSTIARQTTVSQTATQATTTEKKEDKKDEKKEERKEVKPQTRTVSIDPKPVETSLGITPVIRTAEIPKGFDIIDYSHRKLVANMPSIRENPSIRWMMRDSDKRHREMVDGQWNR